jgi:hypothetical protein
MPGSILATMRVLTAALGLYLTVLGTTPKAATRDADGLQLTYCPGGLAGRGCYQHKSDNL